LHISSAGSGKTFLYQTLCYAFRSQNLNVLCVASSGIASLLLPGGCTAHSSFKIPLDLHNDSTCPIKRNTQLASILKSAHLLIWDECSLQHCFAFEAVNRTLQDIRENDLLFGGLSTILGGDFLQILPVVKRGGRSDVIQASLFTSSLWAHI